jgi:hypothetical protein
MDGEVNPEANNIPDHDNLTTMINRENLIKWGQEYLLHNTINLESGSVKLTRKMVLTK